MRKQELLSGIRCATPIMLGYIPIGLAFGVLAVQNNMTIPEIFFMSLFVYAGSVQFIVAGMLASHASPFGIILTTFLVNLRHLLMSAALSPYLKKISPALLSIIAFGITDETFAVDIAEVKKKERLPSFFFGLHFMSQTTWIASTVLGGILGNLIPNPEKLGLDFALPAMFIGLLLMQLKHKKEILVACISGIFSILITLNLRGNWNIIIATIIAATVGMVMEQWIKKSSSLLSE